MSECTCTCHTSSYIGKLVFVERKRLGDRNDSTYNNGEYLIIRQTAFTLYGVRIAKLPDVYYGREVVALEIIGERPFIVCSVSDKIDTARVKDGVRSLWRAAHAPERGEKLNWVANVYTEAKATARELADLLNVELAPASEFKADDGSHAVQRLEANLSKLREEFNALRAVLRKV